MAAEGRPVFDSRSDPEDCSREACDASLAACIAGQAEACTLFYRRLGARLREKVLLHLVQTFDLTRGDAETLVHEKLEDMALLARRGALVIEKSYTLYLIGACANELRDRAVRKKGHEVPFSQLSGAERERVRVQSTLHFASSVAASRGDPSRAAIERELLRHVGEQAGGLPDRLRDVIASTREGLAYPDIAKRIMRSYATVKAEYWQGVTKLRGMIQNRGLFRPPPKPLDEFIYPVRRTPSKRRVLELIRQQEVQIAVPLEMVHFEGKTVRDVQTRLYEGQAAVEALLLHGYWLVHRRTGCRFPHELLHRLPAHPAYKLHEVPFEYW